MRKNLFQRVTLCNDCNHEYRFYVNVNEEVAVTSCCKLPEEHEMFKRCRIIRWILLSMLLMVNVHVFAQKEDISMSSILSKAGQYVNLVEREYGQEIVRMEFDIINNSKQTFRTLTDQYTYGIIAFGDFRIKDIDVKVYKWVNNQWSLIEKDEDTDNVAMVMITPASTAEYKISITAYSFNEGYSVGHYGLIVFHE